MQLFEENGACCDWQVFFFISYMFEDISSLKAITDSPFKMNLVVDYSIVVTTLYSVLMSGG